MAINLRDSYSKVTWDLGSKKMKAEPWGKTDDTGRGIIVTIAQDSVIVTPTTETLRMSFIKPDGTDGYIPATLEGGKYYIENMSQVFAVPGKVNAELEFNDGTEFIKSISFTIDVYESQQSGNIVSSNDYTALQVEIGKINGFASQLAETVTKADTASVKADAMASGSPKGIYATLVALQTAYPTGTTGAYLVTADGKWYYWSGTAWTAGGVYQATGIANRSIKNDYVSSELINSLNKNLYMYNLIFESGTLSGTSGITTANTTRIRTKDFFTPAESMTLIQPIVTTFILYKYNLDGTFINTTNYGTVLEFGFKYKVVLYLSDISENIVLANSSCYVAGRIINSDLEMLKQDVQGISLFRLTDEAKKGLNNNKYLYDLDYVIGGANTSTGSINTTTLYAFRTNKITFTETFKVSSSSLDTLVPFIMKYDSGGTFVGISLIDTDLEAGTYVIGAVKKSNVNITDNTELETLASTFTIYSGVINVDIDDLKGRMTQAETDIGNLDSANTIPSLILPNKIYTLGVIDFCYENIIRNYQIFKNGNYTIRCQTKIDGSYITMLSVHFVLLADKKMQYVPYVDLATLEFKIINTLTNETVDTKEVAVYWIQEASITGKNINTIMIGDSYTDSCGIPSYTKTFLTDKGVTANMLGCNSSTTVGDYDEGYNGAGIGSFLGISFTLRNDRPLSDAIWDTGWGENETYGWTTGQTYADLTETQKLHGRTKNPFYNPSSLTFDFAYYMANRLPSYVPYAETGNHVDAFVIMTGVNDVSWGDGAYTLNAWDEIFADIEAIITSVHAWDSNIKILIRTVNPMSKNNEYLNMAGTTWYSYWKQKRNQEEYDYALIERFETLALTNVLVMSDGLTMDVDYSFPKLTRYPNKFDNTVTTTIVNDIHPDTTGVKYIADGVAGFLASTLI